MISIKDIAKECNVSTTTVSRALNDSNEISNETKKRILSVCDMLGYVPNSSARSLILNKTNMIGLVIPDITNQYYSYVSKGVSSYLERLGYGVVFCNSDRSEDNEARYLKFLSEKRVDGIILIPLGQKSMSYEKVVKNIPLVTADNYVNDLEVSYVGNDNYAGARKIVTHMIHKGYRRIGVIAGSTNSSASNDRIRGYYDVLKENSIKVEKDLVINSNSTFEDGYNYTESLLAKEVDSIFTINDTVAIGVMKYCHQLGYNIPDKLGIAGYDDIEQASMLTIPLTTIHQRKLKLGETAAKLLIEEIKDNNAPKQKIILQPELIIRKSCNE